MRQKYFILFAVFQVVVSTSCCQETMIRIKSNYEEDSIDLRIVNTPITEDSILNLIFILPVEALKEKYKYGSGLDECKKLIDSNKISKNIIFIQPDYSQVPWYGNYDNNSNRGQMQYTVDLINAFQQKYNHKVTRVYLLGFSKSGFGSMNLIIKYPELIEGIMIWDAPLSTTWNEKWGMLCSFGTEENFIKNYFLMRDNGIDFKVLKNKLLIIGGFDLFKIQTEDFLKRLDDNGVKYIWNSRMKFKHEWNKDWIYGLMLHSGFIIENANR